MLRNVVSWRLGFSRSVPAERRSSQQNNPLDAVTVTEKPLSRVAHAGLSQLTAALSRQWQLTIHGIDNFPARGPAILAANHISFLDSPLLMFQLPRRVWFLGKAEYLDSSLSRALFPALGMIPVDRDGGRGALTALRSSLAVLEAGQLLGVYPEGTRSRDGRLYRGHTGLAWIALRSKAPIVPIGIRNRSKGDVAAKNSLRGNVLHAAVLPAV